MCSFLRDTLIVSYSCEYKFHSVYSSESNKLGQVLFLLKNYFMCVLFRILWQYMLYLGSHIILLSCQKFREYISEWVLHMKYSHLFFNLIFMWIFKWIRNLYHICLSEFSFKMGNFEKNVCYGLGNILLFKFFKIFSKTRKRDMFSPLFDKYDACFNYFHISVSSRNIQMTSKIWR